MLKSQNYDKNSFLWKKNPNCDSFKTMYERSKFWDLSHNYEKKYFDFFHIYDLIYDYLNYKVLIRKNVKIMI